MKNKLEMEINRTQACFRAGRGTRDHIFNLRILIQKFQGMNHELLFIDYCKVFDCVIHNKLWESLLEMGSSKKITLLIQSLYIGQESTRRLESGITDWFPMKKV